MAIQRAARIPLSVQIPLIAVRDNIDRGNKNQGPGHTCCKLEVFIAEWRILLTNKSPETQLSHYSRTSSVDFTGEYALHEMNGVVRFGDIPIQSYAQYRAKHLSMQFLTFSELRLDKSIPWSLKDTGNCLEKIKNRSERTRDGKVEVYDETLPVVRKPQQWLLGRSSSPVTRQLSQSSIIVAPTVEGNLLNSNSYPNPRKNWLSVDEKWKQDCRTQFWTDPR